MAERTTTERSSRGRIVMLVDNTVSGDSRVQKQARSAAELGWDVILLGRSPDSKPRRWKIGQSHVRLIPIPRPMAQRRHQFRRSIFRYPLAYPAGRLERYRLQQARAWRSDLAARRALADAHSPALLTQRLAAKAFGRWVQVRSGQSTRMREHNRERNSPFDRLATRYWQATMGNRAWRRLDPSVWDYDLPYADLIDRLKPDIIHANDFRMLGTGARAKLRARSWGREIALVWDAHEFLPGLKPRSHPRWHIALKAQEREYAGVADAVVTVSESLADLLVEAHGLRSRPAVVLNAPYAIVAEGADDRPTLREVCGVPADQPLLVYSGGAASQRGLDVMVEALPELDDVHVAFVVPRRSDYVNALVDRAEELGVADRVHVSGYVPYDEVVAYLSTCDVGVIPIHHWPNHEIALITKFFEYSHARLPIVVSEVRTMAEMTRQTGQGEVFRTDDVTDFVRAVRLVLADPERYRSAYDKPDLLDGWTWEAQASVLDEVYSALMSGHRP